MLIEASLTAVMQRMVRSLVGTRQIFPEGGRGLEAREIFLALRNKGNAVRHVEQGN